ncbi:hypothetical protein CLV98_1077 [Dyadobacter jejuensis]|uniref:TOTE conflict systems S1/CSD-like domain-containing protein n=1 Tax=Dyadobacter jejuensis TaxID=1082580 RepID=A0A316AI25_9BACT|nr:hypothetical protein [Dyadobacter jejuensis]PWJ57301.1 hypothetical protein CLV98_1077 [Dyadobacter jejuensis]
MTANSKIIEGTAKDVNVLRKNGQLTAAYQLAQELLTAQPHNIWNKRAMGWVLLDILKSENEDLDAKEGLIGQLADLQLPLSETIFYDQFRWKLAKYLFVVQDAESPNLEWLLPILEVVVPGSAPSNKYLLKAIIKNSANFVDFLTVMNIWGWDSFEAGDCAPQLTSQGKRMPSLAERAYIATAKTILQRDAYDTPQVGAFIEQLRKATMEQPKWQFALYYYANLLQKVGREQEALRAFIPFAKLKSNDFWVWDLLATLYHDQEEMQLSCYAKALLCKVPDKFSLKIRLKLAQLLIKKGNWQVARVEINKIVETRRQNHWKITPELVQIMRNPSYQVLTDEHSSNLKWYTSHKDLAENLILDQGLEQFAIIWNINPVKNTAQYFVDANIHGGFSLAHVKETLVIGDMVRLHLEKIDKDDQSFYKVKRVKKTSEKPASIHRKAFVGIPKALGRLVLIEDVLIPRHMAEGMNLQKSYSGTALVSYDYTRKKWGWTALEINPL